MKVAIVGSRDFKDLSFVEREMLRIIPLSNIELIVSGGAKGVDTLAEEFASKHEIKTKIFNAEWEKYGRAAGPIRNAKIVDEADLIIAFLAKGSKGTKSTINIAIKEKKDYLVIHI